VKNWDLTLVKSQLDNQTRFGNSSKRSGKNWDLTLVKSQLGNQTRSGNSSKRSGKNWDLTLFKSQSGNQTRSGNSSKRSWKNWLFDCLFLSLSFEYEVYLAFLTLGLLVVLFCRCLTEAVVMRIITGPHALDFCGCLKLEGWILRKTLGSCEFCSLFLGLLPMVAFHVVIPEGFWPCAL
jgi:hypothetical protein